MLSTGVFIQSLIPLYLMLLIGFAGKKFKVFNRNADQVFTQLLLYITLPALILYSLNTTLSRELFTDFIWLITMSIFNLSISVFAAAWVRKKSKLENARKSVYESLIVFGNQGFLGFAISYILMGEQGIIYVTFFNIFYLILIWTYGIYLFTKNEKKVKWKILIFNPGILSTVIGLVVLFLPYKWPALLSSTFESVGKMTIPLSMILIGGLLADIQWYEFRLYSKNVYLWIAASFKLLFLPMLLFVFLFFQVPHSLLIIAVLTAAMPSASTTSVYAQNYGGDVKFSSFGVMLSLLLCILTIPLLYSLLQWLFPLFSL